MKTLKLFIIVCFSILCSLTSCSQEKSNASIEIECFDSIPSDIDGGCCTFYEHPSKMQDNNYIMVNDSASKAYMMINHHFEEFTLVSYENDEYYYSNQKFKLKVKVDSTQTESSESYKMKGLLVLEDHNKNKREINICGDCGW